MFFRKRKAQRQCSTLSEFISVVRKEADRMRAEEPYRNFQKQHEIREAKLQEFLDQARLHFDENTAQFMLEFIAKKIY